MSDLLVGCSVQYNVDGVSKEGVIVKADRNGSDKLLWILGSDGGLTHYHTSYVKINPEDVNFITRLSKDYKLRKKILENKTDRFEILDL